MISAQNRLLPLSGNKWLLFAGIAVMAAACSPKMRPAPAPVKVETEQPVVKPEPPRPVKPPPVKTTISLLLPFGLDHLNPASKYTDVSLKQANLSADYYQGFKLALDSLTLLGYSYKLQVFDTKGTLAESHALAYNQQIRASDLIVGPVFPEDIKVFASVLPSARKPIVSPLSAASPLAINNQNLVTVMPPLEYHAKAAATYINLRIRPQKVFILRSGYSEENEYITPFKSAIDSLSKGRIQVVQLTVVRGRLNTIIPQLSTDSPNIFLMPSTNQAFLTVTMRSLDSLAKKYPVMLFGHPDWGKFSFLRGDVLQRLRVHITSADWIDYKTAATIDFLRRYRSAYHTEASEYAIKGYDEGLYFGKLLAEDYGDIKNLSDIDFTGLHNDFHFIKKPGLGYINTHINMMDYRYYELRKVE